MHLSIGNPDGTLRNILIHQSRATETQPPIQVHWTIDTMAIRKSIKSKKTYKEWFTALIKNSYLK